MYNMPDDYSEHDYFERKKIFTCVECGADIFEGDTYYEIGSETYCVDCVTVETATVFDDENI